LISHLMNVQLLLPGAPEEEEEEAIDIDEELEF